MLAALYDVHGNLPALEAVLADARAQGAEGWILGGDYAMFGGWPAETLALLEELTPSIWVRGNVDRWTADPDHAPEHVGPPARACYEAIGAAAAARLGTLDFSRVQGETLIVHASPRDDMSLLLPEPVPDEAEQLAGIEQKRLLIGHTHLPFRRVSAHGDIEIVNPGSVGMPLDGDHRAAYALVHDDDRIEHRRVAYDHASAAQRLTEAFGDSEWTRTIRARVELARMADD